MTKHSDRRILVIEALSGGVLLVEAALDLGIGVVVASADTEDRVMPAHLRDRIDELVTVETNDLPALLAAVRELHDRLPLSAVFPGCDVYVPNAAHLAAELGLAGLDVRTVEQVRDKTRMREAVAAAGLRGPRFTEVASVEELPKAAEHAGFPCVVKPVDQSGSLHVSVVHDLDELTEAYRRLSTDTFVDLGRPMIARALVEEYLDGPEYSVEGYVLDGAVTVVAVTEKLLAPEPYFAEVGHQLPADLPAGDAAAVEEYVGEVARAVGLTVGPFHCELRLTGRGPVLVEIGARMGGDRIAELALLATGVSLPRVWLAALLGLDPREAGAFGEPVAAVAGIHFFTAPGQTRFERATGLDVAAALPGVREVRLDLAPGDPIHPHLDDFRCRLGQAVFTADSPAAATALRAAVDAAVRINPEAEEER
ncbi:ATP-grasp domain-containing protein [Kitasatospora sp. NPDC088134]|uniref:ATP-grasp domain-containing protein n=1 Tax=Kitasatospora sp. NPDC088134 TaxID=3364071 RepID=UPI0037F69293